MVGTAAQNTVNRTVHLSNIIRAQYSTGRIALPLSGGAYARLKHVQGIPAQTAGGGYSISKLRMIDILVERLVQLKGKSAAHLSGSEGSLEGAASGDPDALLAQYADQVARSFRAANAISPSLTSGLAEPGLLFSLVA